MLGTLRGKGRIPFHTFEVNPWPWGLIKLNCDGAFKRAVNYICLQ
jgi:hypothetical protein